MLSLGAILPRHWHASELSAAAREKYVYEPNWRKSVKHTTSILLLGAKAPAKILEVTLMRPIHGNL